MKRKIYCKICKRITKNNKNKKCPICLDFKNRADYRNFVLGNK